MDQHLVVDFISSLYTKPENLAEMDGRLFSAFFFFGLYLIFKCLGFFSLMVSYGTNGEFI